ncbi:4-amino-4-deoxy-L-arabinose-phosphoundecaprenol flippase subunit ArnF [Escherichia coli]|uniref:4-amino-4-deoxy-L-arabinose-phosphoundecaprenol flippase subunit ArnF n=1 Tax=Escherichia coli TaxID=562 RepID=A0A447XUP8_ECOLX|nr:4-amino-4-deoxy-L-arabinose-phosphoundecaprenol flippase subunit ArnF [Escherichia coli]
MQWLGLALACLGLAMVLWLLVLQNVPVGIAYPMLSLNFVWVTLAAVKLWHEPVSLRHWCGVAFIIGGIVILGVRCNGPDVGIIQRHYCLSCAIKPGLCGESSTADDALMGFIAALLAFGLDARILLLGLLGYLLSVFCWYKTLHKLALSKAYALLSMSYVLVWIASMILPGWEGTFSLKALLGVACIMSGLMLIFLPTTKQRY